MSLLAKLAGFLGLSQSKPTTRPTAGDWEQERVISPEINDEDKEVSYENFHAKPDNLVGDIWNTTDDDDEENEEELERNREESDQGLNKRSPFQTDLNNEDTITNIPQDNTNLMQIRIRPILDIEEINKLNKNIAIKMQKVGVLNVDREIFMKHYNALLKKAMLEKRPISEVLDEIF